MQKTAIFLLIILSLNSCATIFNKEFTFVKISSNKSHKLIYKNDTIHIGKEQKIITPKRSNKPLEITVLNDSIKTKFSLKRKTSALFWANLTSTYGLGMLIDLTNDKRFTYKHNLHFITDSISNKTTLSNKKVAIIPKNELFIYTSPLKAIDPFSIRMFTVGTEYFIKNNFSLSGEYGIKYTNQPDVGYNISYLKNKGALYKFETKWYNGINLTNNSHLNEYLGLELRVLKNQFNDIISYNERTDTNEIDYEYISITDNFATKKQVTIVNFKYGFLAPLGEKFYLDFYSGLGIRIKKFNHINLEYDELIHDFDYDDRSFYNINSFKNYNSKSFLNFSLGFKFGFKL